MGTFLSLCYTAVDIICLILFLDVFAQRRLNGLNFLLSALGYVLLGCWIPLILLNIVGQNQALKIFIVLLIDFIIAKLLYTGISNTTLCFFVSLEYLLSYCLSFTVGMICSTICGMDSNTFQSSKIRVIVYGIIAYSLQLFLALMFRKVMRSKSFKQSRHPIRIPQIILYWLFPCASFMVLIVLLYISTGKNVSEAIIAFTCGLIIAANAAIIFLLERMERAMEREQQLFSLGQQLEVQVRSMESASKLFSEQRKKVHDFRSHLNTLQVLLQGHEYESAEAYLKSVSKQQTERLFLVNTHHTILDALFNTKASEAIQEGVDIDFRVNDLSTLPFEAADMVVLLSNLLDNAIEANRLYCGDKKIHVTALWKRSFLFSIRNTSNPVKIENYTIQTTKSDPQLHGFGLSNVKLILEKYDGDFTMVYEDNWFQFTGEISQQPISCHQNSN